jgi:hypothetical protein
MALKHKAQAITELAILGAIIITAFSFLINYSEKINRQQAHIQQTFRAALAEAAKANNSTVYTKKTFLRMPNVASPMELGQIESFDDSANVLWSNGKDRDDVYIQDDPTKPWRLVARYPHPAVMKYQLNEEGKYVLKDDATGDVNLDNTKQHVDNQYDTDGNLIVTIPPIKPTETITDTFTNAVNATTILTQTQQSGSGDLVTTKTFFGTDKLTANVSIEGKIKTFTQALGAGGKYLPMDPDQPYPPSVSR